MNFGGDRQQGRKLIRHNAGDRVRANAERHRRSPPVRIRRGGKGMGQDPHPNQPPKPRGGAAIPCGNADTLAWTDAVKTTKHSPAVRNCRIAGLFAERKTTR